MALSGKTLCFTGKLELTRADAKKQAEGAGATVTGTMTAKTDTLVAGPGAGAKLMEAASKGITVWTEQDFIDALNATGGKKKTGGGKKKADAAPDPPAKKTGGKKKADDTLDAASKKPKVATSPSKMIASTIVTSTADGDDGATADPDALAGMTAEGLSKNVEVTAHHKLVQIDVASNTDKYFLMQSLSGQTKKKDTKHLVFTRWGRTGTKGQVKCEGPYDSADQASADIAKKFKDKTGNDIATASDGSFAVKAKKYDLVVGDTGKVVGVVGKDGGCLWQYYVSDGVDGKPNGWYDYTTDAAQIVEGVHSEWLNNPTLDVRCVQSGMFCYKVDFNTMDQTNVTHAGRKQRQIRRNA